METIKRTLKAPLTHEELDAKRKDVIEKYREKCLYEEDKKASNTRLNGAIQTLEKEITELVNTIHGGEIEREVECVWRRNEAEALMELVRVDTNAVLESRPMIGDELQLGLTLDGAPAAEDALCLCGHKKSQHFKDKVECNECACQKFEKEEKGHVNPPPPENPDAGDSAQI